MYTFNNRKYSTKSSYTRAQRRYAQKASPMGYKVAKLMSEGYRNAKLLSNELGISKQRAAGYMSRVTRGDYDTIFNF